MTVLPSTTDRAVPEAFVFSSESVADAAAVSESERLGAQLMTPPVVAVSTCPLLDGADRGRV